MSVVFDPSAFKTRYPELDAVSNDRLQALFDEAYSVYFSAADSLVPNETKRLALLNILTAHLAVLGGALSLDGAPPPVGRVASATEGSVSVSTDYQQPGTQAWYVQTVYGAAFWEATIYLRSFRYVSKPTTW